MNHLPGKLEDSASLTRLDTEVGARGNRDEVALFPPEPTVWLQLLLLLPELELLLAALPVEMCRPWARLAMAVNVSSKPVMSGGGGGGQTCENEVRIQTTFEYKEEGRSNCSR